MMVAIIFKMKGTDETSNGNYYHDFVDFTPLEIRQRFAVYVLHGLTPSPGLEMKFKTEKEDCMNGNDFIANTLNSQPHHSINPR